MPGIVFLDRDGTLIQEQDYLSDPDRVILIPGAAEGLRLLAEQRLILCVVSNQAGIARGKITESQLEAVHDRFVSLFAEQGVTFDAIEYCPHHPEGSIDRYRQECGCRKPATGMAERILSRFSVPPSWSRWVVGDKMIDIEMGRRLGARTVLVSTGYGVEEAERCATCGILPNAYLSDIKEAASWIVAESVKK
ncbi:MAG TPA: HAD family hydrolase [Candidatus Deferrimicrobiaceae bacterium]|jgi:D-glycero-D-manno-heptose 1,7-bisphosphate phosphatase